MYSPITESYINSSSTPNEILNRQRLVLRHHLSLTLCRQDREAMRLDELTPMLESKNFVNDDEEEEGERKRKKGKTNYHQGQENNDEGLKNFGPSSLSKMLISHQTSLSSTPDVVRGVHCCFKYTVLFAPPPTTEFLTSISKQVSSKDDNIALQHRAKFLRPSTRYTRCRFTAMFEFA